MLYRPSRKTSPLVDLSPLIDVVFLLLIFFMVSTRFKDDHGLDLALPKSESRQAAEIDKLTIAIDTEGRVFLGGEAASLEGLKSLIEKKLLEFENKMVVLKVDENVNHGMVVEVMDAAKMAGAEGLTFAAVAKGAGSSPRR